MAETALRDLHRAPPPGMAPFLVAFEVWRGGAEDRRQHTNSQIELAELNRKKLLEFIETQGLESDVRSVASPTLIGMVGVVMTPRAAERISTMEGVARVIRAR